VWALERPRHNVSSCLNRIRSQLGMEGSGVGLMIQQLPWGRVVVSMLRQISREVIFVEGVYVCKADFLTHAAFVIVWSFCTVV